MAVNRFRSVFHSFQTFITQMLVQHGGNVLLLLLGVLVPLYIFGDLAEDVWQNEGGFPWDIPVLLAVHQTASPQLDWFASNLTHFGVFWGVFPVSGALFLYYLQKHQWRLLLYLVTSLVGSAIINRTAKVLLHRARPHLWQSVAPEFDYGFPSGHAMSSMTLVVVLVVLTWPWRRRWLVWLGGLVFVVAIAWTRLYLGVHYPSDILAGWAVSIGWALGVSLILQPHAAKQLKSRELPASE